MGSLDEHRQQRAQRRLRCDAFQADLHATPSEHVDLVALLDAQRAGLVSLDQALELVGELRARQALEQRTQAA